MTDAEYYQAHKDNPDEWGQPERPTLIPGSGRKGESRRLDSMISTRFDPPMVARLRQAAARVGVSVSDYIRWLVAAAVYAPDPTPQAGPSRTSACEHLSMSGVAWAQCSQGCDMRVAA